MRTVIKQISVPLLALAALLLTVSIPCAGQGALGRRAGDSGESVQELKEENRKLELQNLSLKRDLIKAHKELERLKARLAATGGGGPADDDNPGQDAPAPSGIAPQFIKFPSRKVSGMGMIRESESKLADRLPGATRVRLLFAERAETVETKAGQPGGGQAEVAITFKRGRSKVTLAKLCLKTDGLYWVWEQNSPAGLRKVLKELDGKLQTAMFEQCSDRTVLARYQVKPIEVKIAVGRSGTSKSLPLLSDAMTLRYGPTPAGWKLEEEWGDDGNVLFLSNRGYRLASKLDLAAKKIKVSWSNPDGGRANDIDEEIREWENDNRKLAERMLTLTNDRQKQLDQEAIDANKEHIVELKAEKKKLALDAARRARPFDKNAGITADIALPNGMIVYKLNFVR